jgi:hypothetical protein
VHTHAKPVHDGADEHSYVILWRSGKVDLEPIIGERPRSRGQFDGALPFRFGALQRLEQVDLAAVSLLKEYMVKDIENATEHFVRWLAEYLEEPAIRGAADDVNRRRFGSSY